jgi:hypothetical protein
MTARIKNALSCGQRGETNADAGGPASLSGRRPGATRLYFTDIRRTAAGLGWADDGIVVELGEGLPRDASGG